ncbi:RNA polymerase sigma factor [Candidatus Poribacteria bacterium]|nr:RNA polymerase sigma factor [Candidatus Poribacteria bacterium]
MKNDDAQLIQRILAGDQSAFNTLVRKYQKSVHAFVWRKIGDYHIAEEVTQDIFLRVHQKLDTLNNQNSFAGWLYVIAARYCFAWFEKKRVPMQSLEAMPAAELENLAYTEYHTKQQREFVSERQREVVKQLLQKLPVSERTTVSLHYLNDMTCEDISKSMGVSPNTVKSRLHRARKRLQQEEHRIFNNWGGHKGDIIMSGKMQDIRSKFNTYMGYVESFPLSDEDIHKSEEVLMEVDAEVETALKSEITPELVHLVVDDIYPHIGKVGMEKRIALLRRYQDAAPNDTERFWAKHRIVHSYPALERNREAIEEQISFYHWACKHMSDKHVLETLSNLTIIECWKQEGRIDEWMQLHADASQRLDNPEVSDFSRCDFLQIGSEVLRAFDRFDEALIGFEKLESANKDQDWEHYFRFWLAVRSNRLRIYSKQEDWGRFDPVLKDVGTFIDGEVEKHEAGYPVNIDNLIWAAHDIGCCLVWSEKYEDAKRFLKISLDLQNKNDWAYFMLAVSIWATEKDREKTLHNLKLASDYILNYWNEDRYYPAFLETPEFSDVWDDPEFLKVLGK